jgi:hypothetical protein
LRNAIFSNGGLGIDLGDDGVTANDFRDADTGPNLRQNYPTIEGVALDEVRATIRLRLGTNTVRTYRIELFVSSSPDPSGYGEGARFLGDVEVSRNSLFEQVTATISVPSAQLPPRGWLTATATDENGNTSEFSPAVNVSGARPAYRPASRALPPAAPPPVTFALNDTDRRRDPVARELLT